MSIFSSKKNTEIKTAKPVKKAKEVAVVSSKKPKIESEFSEFSATLIRPRITEKASELSEKESVYVFDVLPSATKKTIAKAFKEIYKIEPIKIAVIIRPAKQVFVRGKWGKHAGGKKAYIYIKKGEKIELI